MKTEDIMNQDNNRADAIDKLINFCVANNLSYSYGEASFTITLPGFEPVPNAVEQNVTKGNVRKTFRIDSWGPKGPIEGEEPNPELPLEEGEPPKETL
jgi:hypothetical protein